MFINYVGACNSYRRVYWQVNVASAIECAEKALLSGLSRHVLHSGLGIKDGRKIEYSLLSALVFITSGSARLVKLKPDRLGCAAQDAAAGPSTNFGFIACPSGIPRFFPLQFRSCAGDTFRLHSPRHRRCRSQGSRKIRFFSRCSSPRPGGRIPA